MVETKICEIIEEAMEELGFRLVRVLYSANNGGHNQLQIMAEPKDNSDMSIEDCQLVSKHVSALLDVEDPIPSGYALEVSSPGLDRPLTRLADYERFNGELAKIRLKLMHDGRRRFTGRLGGLSKNGLVILDTSFGRYEFSFDEIEVARIDPVEILKKKT